jgi:uncharacterized protein YecE (DUF72 family)
MIRLPIAAACYRHRDRVESAAILDDASTLETMGSDTTRARVCIGTSGWNYPAWRENFYRGVPQKLWLQFCAERFTAVEVNATFYRLQRRETFADWRARTPARFRFAIKANRYLTHNRKLIEPLPSIRIERDHAAALGDRLAAVLWQLPANFHCDLNRLERFARALRYWRKVRHAIEFRHPSWFVDDIAGCLRAHGIAVCQSDAADWPLWDAVTTDLVYVRLHGHSATYASGYAGRTLNSWARRIERWRGEGREVHVYFDNDARGRAPIDALRLMHLLSIRP